MKAAAALEYTMDIPFKLRKLDCDPFYPGYGRNCSEAKLAFEIWYMPIRDISNKEVQITFYITHGDGLILLGNETISNSELLGTKDHLVIPPNVNNLSDTETILETYTDGEADSKRTYIFVFPSKTKALRSYFGLMKSLKSSQSTDDQLKKRLTDGKVAKRFAMKLHGISHLPLTYMEEICRRAEVLTPQVKKSLESVVQKCSSCKSTGRPNRSRNVSLSKPLNEFNEHVQIDYFFMNEFDN